MLVLRIVMIIFTILWLLYFLWIAGVYTDIIHFCEGKVCRRDVLAPLFILLAFGIHLFGVFCFSGVLLALKIALIATSVLWALFSVGNILTRYSFLNLTIELSVLAALVISMFIVL